MLRNMSVISSCVVRSVQIKVGFMNIVKGYHHTVFLMLWWSSCWVCGVVRLYLCLQPRVMLGSSTPGCWQPQDQTCPRLSRHSRLSTIFMVQHSSSQTFQTLSLEMNQPEVLLSLFWLCVSVLDEEARLVLIISEPGIWSPIKAVIYNVTAGRELSS